MTVITPITLTEWRTRVRNRADLYSSSFVSDGTGDGYDGYGGELCSMINDSLGKSYDFLIECFGDEFFMNSCAYTVMANIDAQNEGEWIGTMNTETAYPMSPHKIFGVKFKYNNLYYPCKRIEKNQSITDVITARNWYPGGVYYSYHWEWLRFYPTATSTQYVLIDMVPALKVLYYPTDYLTMSTVSTPLNQHPLEKFADLTVLDVAIKCLNKQERDVTALNLELEQLKDHVRKNSPRLDRTPRTIVDAQRNSLGYDNWYFRRWGI